MFHQARLYMNLTPAQRALLRLIDGVLVAAFIAGVVAAYPYVATADAATVSWGTVAHVFAVAFVGAVGAAIMKYFKAQSDPALPSLAARPAAAGAVVTGAAGSSVSGPPGAGGAYPPLPGPTVYAGGAVPVDGAPAAPGS